MKNCPKCGALIGDAADMCAVCAKASPPSVLDRLADAFRLPYVVVLKSTAFQALLGPDWVARNPTVPVFLRPQEIRPEGPQLDRRTVGIAIERLLTLLSPLDDGQPEIVALRRLYRDIFLKLLPDFWRRFEADLARQDMDPVEGIRLSHLGLNCWETDPRKDPKAKRLWALGAASLERTGAAELAAPFAAQAKSLPDPAS